MLFPWLSEHYIEVLGCITGLIYLYFSIKQIIWLWPLGIITSFLYIFVFFQSKFYAGMSLQVYYLFISIYGWFYWSKGKKDEGGNKIPIRIARPVEWSVFILITFEDPFLVVISITPFLPFSP